MVVRVARALSSASRLRAAVPAGAEQVGVLFSGGVDSATLAALAHRHVRADAAIDLINVAFANPNKAARRAWRRNAQICRQRGRWRASSAMQDNARSSTAARTGRAMLGRFDVPDRLTGVQALGELCRACPGRVWRWIEVDVDADDVQASERAICAQRAIALVAHALARAWARRSDTGSTWRRCAIRATR